MASKPDPATTIQRKYYTDTASRYDHMHAHEGGADASITKFMYALLRTQEVRTILDVGTATGTGMRDLKQALPDVFVCGVEPVAALVEQAVLNGNIASGPVIQATGEALPFADASFDAVSEFATLHHAANPTAAQKAPPGLIAGSLTSYNY
jgi:ubiquinone/menaquinone biosynthesis C-methylase UbiE